MTLPENAQAIAGIIVILGAIYLSIYFHDVFQQFKFIWEIPIIFGASFWIGLFWRRATASAVWVNVIFASVFFFILPVILPSVNSGMRTNEK